ncbi:MAG: neutral zinc metallopeptidase [Streptosporangiales bacterium]
MVIVSLAGGDDDSSASSSSSPSSTYSYSPSYSSITSTPTAAGTLTGGSTGGPTTSYPTDSSTDGDGGGSSVQETLKDNGVYDTGSMKTVNCGARITSTSTSPYKRFVHQITACLNKAWRQQLSKDDSVTFRAPSTVISQSKHPNSPCSSGDIGYIPIAFYCGTNHTMYYSVPGAQQYSLSRYREYLTVTPAHEYGHAVQGMVGISQAYGVRYQRAYPKVKKYTRLSRRTELQGQCFAGLFIGRNYSSMGLSENRVRYTEAHVGDNAVEGYKTHPDYRTHGSFHSNDQWFYIRGWVGNDGGRCDSWSVSAGKVD